MNFLKKLFGGATPPTPPPASPTAVPKNPAEDPNMIRVFDSYGRELFMTRQQWRDNVLLGNIEKHWNDPERLAGLIIQSLQDGFFDDMVKPAERLAQIDPNAERSAVLLAIVYLKVKRLGDSEKVLLQHARKHGESGVVLTNLAKVYSERGEEARSLETLWRGLELDPNQDNGLGWYEVIHRDKGGEEAGLEALRRIAALPGSWRAQLWLARATLKSRQTDQAFGLYRECLSRVGKPVPSDVLMQMSGDLGNAGHLPEILQLVAPHFDAATHGLQVGNNLLKAHLDLGQLDAARRILNQLYALNRPDWSQHLRFWDTEIAKATVSLASEEPQAQIKIAMLTGEGPVWLKPTSPAAELFPAKPADAVAVCFLGGTAEIATNSKCVERQLADAPGRMSRALPLFLAEQVEFASRARTRTLVPWIAEPSGGFVLSGVAWTDEDAASHSRQGDLKSDYVVISHLKTQTDPWTAELRLVRTIDGKCLGQLSESFPSTAPTDAVRSLARELLDLISRTAEIELQPVPSSYMVPAGAHFPAYLLRLEQLLAVRCSGMEGVPAGFLNGEREIIDGNIHQCLETPGSVTTRILLAQTLLAMKRVRPDILPEFKERLTLLQKEHPLAEPAQGVVQRLFHEALAV